jgi:hypothetical protein
MFRFLSKRSSGRRKRSGSKMLMTSSVNSYSPANADDVIDREIGQVQVVPIQVK